VGIVGALQETNPTWWSWPTTERRAAPASPWVLVSVRPRSRLCPGKQIVLDLDANADTVVVVGVMGSDLTAGSFPLSHSGVGGDDDGFIVVIAR
jgi:hypothetical protein